MTAILVDSNVLLDVMTQDSRWFAWSAETIERAADGARLIINPVIYAEVSVLYSRIEDLDLALSKNMFEREPIPYEAAFLAGKAFLAYRRWGGKRRSPLPDFFIVDHAAVTGHRLMTRDPRRYRAYFPKLSLIAPD
jgi:predicted nucleic acid-binding protein